MSEQDEVRVLILNEGEDRSRELFRVKKGWIIQIVLSSSLSWRDVQIFSNACRNATEPFSRETYYPLKWNYPSSRSFDDSNRYVYLQCYQSGTFHYYFTIDGTTRNGQGYFQVEHQLLCANERIEQNCLTCQTVISKCLGASDQWLSRLEVTFHSGYNLIHFTPIQILSSVSNSSYSIANHHRINPLFQGNSERIKEIVQAMEKQWKISSIVDLVYNHVATDCILLREHPDASYNLVNSPHLKPAVLLDAILIQFTRDASEGKLAAKGILAEIKENHLELIRDYLLREEIPRYRLEEYYLCDRTALVREFRAQLVQLDECPVESSKKNIEDLRMEHGTYQRMQSRVNLQLARELFFFQRAPSSSKDQWVDRACEQLDQHLLQLNQSLQTKFNENIQRAVENCLQSCRYHFFAYEGTKYSKLSFPDQPFVGNYFCYPDGQILHPDEIREKIENDLRYQTYLMAHNGWVMNDNPMRNFAQPGEEIYLRRDLIQWSDVIKLRYGEKREDSPALYDYMKEYTRLAATTFHGCRLDNCHSTPLWLAQQMMDYARQINPQFYINAELFTGDVQIDNYFINHIGINSLVRESYRAFDPHELGQIASSCSEGDPIGSFVQPNVRPLISSKPYSWLYDQTHDNPSQIQRRSVEDALPRSAVVAMSNCSTGSNRGYDELVPHHIDVVHEKRLYSQWAKNNQQSPPYIDGKTGIIQVKKALNKLHIDLAQQGFTQLMVDQISRSVLLMTRHNPRTHESILLISHQSFYQVNEKWEYISPLTIEGVVDRVLLEATSSHPQDIEPVQSFEKAKDFINGLKQTKVYFQEHLPIEKSRCVLLTSPNSPDYTGFRTIEFTDQFRPGSILVLQVSLLPQFRQSIISLEQMLNQYVRRSSDFHQIVAKLTLADLQRVLYRSSAEEQADGKGFDLYNIPDLGPMVYCGLQGPMSILEKIRLHNQLKHPLVLNLKQGDWLVKYIANRLKVHPNTKQLGDWFGQAFEHLSQLSRLMIPMYFDLILTGAYPIFLEHGWSLMNPFISRSSTGIRALAQASVQLISIVPNARLPILSPNLREPRPVEGVDALTLGFVQQCPSLAAGLPHFASGIWRNWGRDTFISLRGLLLLTGRYQEARYLILSYGQCLRHGLIPNLLADGKLARYNARDAVWWWLHSISTYTQCAPNGHEILSDQVSRLYPTDDSPPQPAGAHEQSLYDVIQEVLLRHAQSLSYRERGAGFSLDSNMTDEGFNNQIGVDWRTGFVFGGSRWNCGTWMDKMGSSERAKNQGHPATPRDGSAVELVGLLRAILAWLIQSNRDGHYPYQSVEISSSPRTSQGSAGPSQLLFTDWLQRIDQNFEKEFWVDQSDPSKFVNRRQIYKDTVNSALQWTDFQLRPNFLVAAVLAPEMFDKTHVWSALEQVESVLLGKFGMKTLDPSDYNYLPDYINDDDSDDYKRAGGFNYHNGPEWLWLTGYYIRAKLYWSKQQDDHSVVEQTIKHIRQLISSLTDLLLSNDWKGLPELTNGNGQFCPYSCAVQAWSSATLLEALFDLTAS